MEDSDNPENGEARHHQESFGDFLKRHREASGKSLEDIAGVTKISIHYLRAFEENDSRRFPAATFTRGFLRGYANEIGLDVDICMERFEEFQRSLKPSQVKKEVTKLRESTVPLNEVSLISPKIAMIGLGAVVVATVVGLLWWQGVSFKGSSPETQVADKEILFPQEPEVLPEDPPSVDLDEIEDNRVEESQVKDTEAEDGEVVAEVEPFDEGEAGDSGLSSDSEMSTGSEVDAAASPDSPKASSNKKTKSDSGASATVVPVTPSLLEITALRSSGLRVRLDDNPAERVKLASGETKSFYVFKEVEIRDVTRGDFTFKYNGRPLEVAGSMIKLFNRHLFNKSARGR